MSGPQWIGSCEGVRTSPELIQMLPRTNLSVFRRLAAGTVLLAGAFPLIARAQTDSTHTHVDKTFFTRRDAIYSGIALAGSAGISVFDERIADWTQSSSVQGSQSRHDFVNGATHVNETPLTIAAVLTYGVGRLTRSETVTDIGLHASEAMILTDVISETIRGPIGRARPRVSQDDQYNFKFWAGFTEFDHRSFPSLHSASGFAMAAALSAEIHERNASAARWASPILYTAALIPGVTRMYLNQHWASDIVSGAFVGALIGHKVVRYAHTHKQSKLDRILMGSTVIPDGRGGMLASITLTP